VWDADYEQGERTESFVRRFIELTSSTSGNRKLLSELDFDREELVHKVEQLYTAADDTTSTALLWAFVWLSNHPDVQARMHRELADVVGDDRLPSLEDESKLPYTQAVIFETFRRNTGVPLSLSHETT
jgi:cytochrome P450